MEFGSQGDLNCEIPVQAMSFEVSQLKITRWVRLSQELVRLFSSRLHEPQITDLTGRECSLPLRRDPRTHGAHFALSHSR